MNTLFDTDTTPAKHACKAAHTSAAELFGRLGGFTHFSDGTGPVGYPDFQNSVDDALLVALLRSEPTDFEDADRLGEQTVAVNVMRRGDGSHLYEVMFADEGSDEGTICKVKDLKTLHEWFENDWVERED